MRYKRHRTEKRLIICSVCGEARPHKARGMCARCVNKFYKERSRGTCPKCGRENTPVFNGRCDVCYQKERNRRPVVCAVCGKIKPHYALGCCKRCYSRYKRDRKNVRIEDALYYKVRYLAEQNGETVSNVVNDIVRIYFMERDRSQRRRKIA